MAVIEIKLILDGNKLVQALEEEREDNIRPSFDVKPEWEKYTQMYRSGEIDKDRYAKIVQNMKGLTGNDLTKMYIRYVMENRAGEPLIDYAANEEEQ
ncbi:hypothetical protein ACFL03_06485 [Thermodesulfobacteriota bacterium]